MPHNVEFLIRLPAPMKEWVRREAERDLRSQNSVVLLAIREKMESAEQRAAS
jgi:hypothetical protein